MTPPPFSEGWWFVAFGDEVVVEAAFGFDVAGSVLGAGAAAFGHGQAAVFRGFWALL